MKKVAFSKCAATFFLFGLDLHNAPADLVGAATAESARWAENGIIEAKDDKKSPDSIVHVANNAALMVYNGPSTIVARHGFAAAGDGGSGTYNYTRAACSRPDGGKQVPSSRGGCWVADTANPASVLLWGAKSDATCTFDNTVPFRNAIAASAGSKLVVPNGVFCLNSANSTLVFNDSIEFAGQGSTSKIVWSAPVGSPAAPIFDVKAAGVSLHDLSFDQQADTRNYTNSTYFGKNVWGNVGLIVQGDNFVGYNLYGYNAFDNCIGIVAIDLSTNLPKRGLPQKFVLNKVRTQGCGVGNHTDGGPGKIGAGIDNGSGSAGVISDAIDIQSYAGFINDVGAGAYADWSNITAFYTKVDEARPKNGSGWGLYSGSANSSFSNVTIISPGRAGVFWGAYNDNSVMTNLLVKGPQEECMLVKGPININGLNCIDSSQAGRNGSAAVSVDTTGRSISPFIINNFHVSGREHSYSLKVSGPNNVIGYMQGGPIDGVSGAVSIASAATGLRIMSASANGLGFGHTDAAYPWDFVGTARFNNSVLLPGLPTSCAGQAKGALWRNGSAVNICP